MEIWASVLTLHAVEDLGAVVDDEDTAAAVKTTTTLFLKTRLINVLGLLDP